MMTWFYESFWVVPKGWAEWSKSYPDIELRWVLKIVREKAYSGRWRIIEGNYSAISYTRLSKEYLDERFDTWDDAVSRAHDLVSTVAVGGIDSKTWPEAKVRAESQYDPVLF